MQLWLLLILGVVIIFVVILVGFLLFLAWIIIRERTNILTKTIGGPVLKDPIFGSIQEGNSFETVFQRWQTYVNKYGRLYRYYSIFGKRWIVTTDPIALKHILVANAANFKRGPLTGVDVFERIVGKNSMLLMDGDRHKKHRSIISPAFKICNIRRFTPVMHSSTKQLMQRWDKTMEDGQILQVDIRHYMSRVTLHIIGCVAFGFDFDCINEHNHNSQIVQALEQVVQVGSSACDFKIWHLLPIMKYIPIKKVRTLWAGINKLHMLCDSMIKERKMSNIKDGNKNLLDLILEASTNSNCPIGGQKLSDDELRDEMMTFILAGHETSSLSLTWTLWLLCKYAKVQDSLRSHIHKQMNSGEEINFDDMNKVDYLRAVIYESLRLMPPIPFFPRTSISDDYFHGKHFPAGTSFGILIAHAGRLEEFWGEDANEFRPERFLEENVPWKAWLPFGDGTHKCIGYQLAVTEISVILMHLIHNYEFNMRDEMHFVNQQTIITLAPTFPILLDIRKI